MDLNESQITLDSFQGLVFTKIKHYMGWKICEKTGIFIKEGGWEGKKNTHSDFRYFCIS